MKKLLFIVPPHINYQQFVHPAFNERVVHKKNGDFGSVLTDMPLGVLLLSAYIKKMTSVETRLIDFNVALNKLDSFDHRSFAEYFMAALSAGEFNDFDPGIIAISALFTPAYQNMIDIARCCRSLFPKAVVIAGGGVPSNMFEQIFNESECIDALCFGEGEKPLLALVKADNQGQLLAEHASWITRDKVRNGERFQHDFIDDLDEIPFYDLSLCVVDDYSLNPALTAYASIAEKNRNFHVMTSRGCPFYCCFCSSHTVHGRKMRYYSLARIREDFCRLQEEYGARILVFQDDHFVADRQRVFQIMAIVKELGLKAVFQNGLALYALDRQMLESFRSAGVDQMMLSIESGSERVLKEIMHKPLDLSVVKRVADDCRDLGIYTNVNILIGLPGETKQDIEEARAFLKTIYANWFLIFCASPLVGSEMYEICRHKKYLKEAFIGSDYKKAVVETEDFTAEYIQETAYRLNLELNFVENSDLRLGNYAMALKGLENAIKAKKDHALAYFYAAKCYDGLGDTSKAADYRQKARSIIAHDQFWRVYADLFRLPVEEEKINA